MIKKIDINQLEVGMYVHYLNCGWMYHPFVLNRFMISDAATLHKALKIGIAEVYIDTDLGVDVGDEPSMIAVEKIVEPLTEPATNIPDIPSKLSRAEELNRAKDLYSNANNLMRDIIKDVRFGKQIALNLCEPMIADIVDSMLLFPSAILPLAQIKDRDNYLFQHSVSVASLAVAFGRVLNLPRDEIEDIALGGLLHDVGIALVPKSILNKQGELSGEEFHVIKKHVLDTTRLLNNLKGVSEITFNAATQHHERYDGTGYPYGLKADQISPHGQMLAIVDAYDAITSHRAHQKGMPPTRTLKKLYEWSGSHFNPRLVQAFIKGIGIYPAGSLVRMESERLAIVRDVATDKPLEPIVQLIYDCNKMCHIPPETIDVSASNDKIKSHESFEKWGIDQVRWTKTHIRKRFRAEPVSPD